MTTRRSLRLARLRALALAAVGTLLLASSSCPAEEDLPITDPTQCFPGLRQDIVFTLLSGPEVSPPSNVRLSFRLEDAEGEPVPRLDESDFTFFEEGRNDDCPTLISVDEADRALSTSPRVFQYAAVLVLDLSGSVINDNLDVVREAATSFVETVMPEPSDESYRMAVYWFDGSPGLKTLVALTEDRGALVRGIAAADSSLSADQTTDLFGAVIGAADETEATLAGLTAEITGASMVLFTDGRDRAQRNTRAEALARIGRLGPDVTAFAIGLGNEINPEDLRAIGRDGLAQSTSADQLVEVFRGVGDRVVDEAESFYNFEYCSPIRSGSADLYIEARDGARAGSLRVRYSGEGFAGGCRL